MPRGPGIELEKAEFFGALGPQRLSALRPRLRERRFTRHRILFFEGEPAEYLWVVRTGEVRLYKASASARVATLEHLLPGEAFGVLSAAEELYPASAETLTEGSAWCLPRAVFVTLLEEEPRLAVEVLRIVSKRLHGAHERLRAFAHDPVPARLARALLETANSGSAHVTRRVLAEAAGTTVETAIRVLRGFEKQGILRGSVGRLDLLDEEALRRIAGDR